MQMVSEESDIAWMAGIEAKRMGQWWINVSMSFATS
jgi:hypothetical protein